MIGSIFPATPALCGRSRGRKDRFAVIRGKGGRAPCSPPPRVLALGAHSPLRGLRLETWLLPPRAAQLPWLLLSLAFRRHYYGRALRWAVFSALKATHLFATCFRPPSSGSPAVTLFGTPR